MHEIIQLIRDRLDMKVTELIIVNEQEGFNVLMLTLSNNNIRYERLDMERRGNEWLIMIRYPYNRANSLAKSLQEQGWSIETKSLAGLINQLVKVGI